MFERIDILKIVRRHLQTLRNIGDDNHVKKITANDKLLFFVFPVLISLTLTFFQISLDSQVANLIAIISIFGGFLFNLLALIYGFLEKIKNEKKELETDLSKVKKRFANEINANISFNILISLVTTIFLIIYNLIPSSNCQIALIYYVKSLFLFITYFLLILFVLTLLMVLNRIYILLQVEDTNN